MPLRDPTKASAELDNLATGDGDVEHIKTLVAEGDKVHVEVHMSALEGDYPTLDTRAVRAALCARTSTSVRGPGAKYLSRHRAAWGLGIRCGLKAARRHSSTGRTFVGHASASRQ